MANPGKINLRAIVKVTGLLMVIEGLFMLSCLGFSIWYDRDFANNLSFFNPNHDFLPLLVSGSGISIIGLLLWIANKRLEQNSIGKREGYIIVSFSWIIISLFGAIPFLISGVAQNYTDAFFETMSGFTTTGASIFTDIESIPKGILFWRSLTHWIGGMGIIVLSLAILPILGIGGMQLFVAEVPGITPDKLHPRIKQTAKRLWGIYVLLTLVLTILLMFGGMNLFDALCHAFGTLATGGFSTKNDSIAGFSPYIQYVIIIFMFLAGTNFTLHHFGLKGHLKKVWDNEEFRNYLYLLVASSVIIALALFFIQGDTAEKSFRDALFQVVSIVTTTGYITTDYLLWPFFA
ncbi:MAG TPA: potassium transporter TrkG, partial [Lentimicrobium sp.]|nr:potassium transporter TrkG [Lentimicrobium sp.]